MLWVHWISISLLLSVSLFFSVPPPRWASSNLGIFLCVNCVGLHRGLGVNCSITKSIELDKWTEPMYQVPRPRYPTRSILWMFETFRFSAYWRSQIPFALRGKSTQSFIPFCDFLPLLFNSFKSLEYISMVCYHYKAWFNVK